MRPYPEELEEVVETGTGEKLVLRPVLPEDEEPFRALFTHMTKEDVRMRFFAAKRVLSQPMAEKMTHIDYDREMALVLAEPGPAGGAEVYGSVHVSEDADGAAVEFDMMLRSDMAGLGFGPMMLGKIIDYCRTRGYREMIGEVLSGNRPMLALCEHFGFTRARLADDPGVLEVRLPLP